MMIMILVEYAFTIKYKHLNFVLKIINLLAGASRHACLSSCEIIINVDKDDIYCNGTIRKNTANKKDPASEDIAKKVFGRNDTGGKEIDRKVVKIKRLQIVSNIPNMT